MIALVGTLCVWIVYFWIPPSPHRRALAMLNKAPMPFDARIQRWWTARRLRHPGQPLTTRLVQTLITELNAGVLPNQAFQRVAGVASPEALRAHSPTIDTHIWHDVASVWSASNEAGFSMAGAMQRIHSYALTDQEIAREVRANAAAPKWGLVTMAAMPAAAWMMGGAMGGDPVHWLFTTPLGWICLIIGLSLYMLAAWLMQRMTKAAMR